MGLFDFATTKKVKRVKSCKCPKTTKNKTQTKTYSAYNQVYKHGVPYTRKYVILTRNSRAKAKKDALEYNARWNKKPSNKKGGYSVVLVNIR